MIELPAGDAILRVDEVNGGRIAGLTIGGFDVIVGRDGRDRPSSWGCFPMAPWAGRTRHGRFRFDGRDYTLPINHAPHAMHGTVYDQPWTVTGPSELTVDLGPNWPFAGHAVHRFTLTPSRLHCVIEVHADDVPMPAAIGWHPWFVKPDSLTFTAGSMLRLDAEDIPDGTLATPPPPGPWDDCFIDVVQPVVLRWGDLSIEISSDCTDWIVYDKPDPTTCVEPQSAPPNALGNSPFVVQPGTPLTRQMTWQWRHGAP